jgi:hypothetical protein
MSSSPVIFIYSYNCGGLADMIKGSSTAYFIATETNRPFQIRFHHKELASIFPENRIETHTTKPILIKLIDRKISGNLLDIANQTKHIPMYIFSNTPLDFFNIIPNYLDKIKPYFQEFYSKWLPINNPPLTQHAKYQVLHCRMGDLYLNEATNKGDNRIKNIEHFNGCLETYKQKCLTGLPVLVCSDHKETRDKLLKEIPNSFPPNGSPYHFAYNTRKQSTEQIIHSTKNTLHEHYQMSKGDHIHIFAYSGFPIIASLIGNIPIYIMKPEDPKGFIPYTSVWTP